MRLGLLVGGGLTPFNRAVLADLETSGRHEIVCAALDARPALPLWARIRRHLRKGRGLYLGVMIASELLREPDAPADAYFAARGVPLLAFTGYDDAAFMTALAGHAPDALVLIGGFGILKKPLLDLAPQGTLSYHHGDMRRYRGQPPAFWEVCRGEAAMGVTVQLIGEKLDAGLPVAEIAIPIGPGESLGSVTRRAFAQSIPLMRQALDKVASGAPLAPLETLGPVYSLPNLRQWLACHWRILRRRLVLRS